MDRRYKILLYILGFFVALACVYLIIRGLVSPSPAAPGGQNSATSTGNVPPPLTLSLGADEENNLKEFVKNFVTLYNNYSYADFSNLTALGDFENQAMQQKSQDLINQLQSTLPVGYSQSSEPQLNTFSYTTTDLQTIIIKIQVKINETNTGQSQIATRSSQEPQSFIANETLTLVRYNQSWLVDDVQITK